MKMPAPAQGTGPQGLHPLSHLVDRGYPFRGIRRGDFKHLQAVPAQTYLIQQLFGVLYPLAGP